MNLGKSIRIYLKEGTVSGIKLAEVVNHTIQALSCPRNKLPDLNKYFNKESNKPGIYFLFGDDGTNKVKVYIGEAENVWDRIKTHDLKKEFWSEVILFTSKDENLTKSHVKYLESRLINISSSANRYQIDNSNSPSLTSLPLPDQDSMEDFISNLKILTGTLGHKFLENPISLPVHLSSDFPPKTSSEKSVPIQPAENLELQLNVNGLKATAIQTDEGIVVLQGSEVSKTDSQNYGYKILREKLISEGIISATANDKLVFSKNYLFKNPSPAASVIVGYSINGRTNWKNKSGKNLNDIEATGIKAN